MDNGCTKRFLFFWSSIMEISAPPPQPNDEGAADANAAAPSEASKVKRTYKRRLPQVTKDGKNWGLSSSNLDLSKPIPTPAITILEALTQSRKNWSTHAFVRRPTPAPDIPQFDLGPATAIIGPHIFASTRFWKVVWPQTYGEDEDGDVTVPPTAQPGFRPFTSFPGQMQGYGWPPPGMQGGRPVFGPGMALPPGAMITGAPNGVPMPMSALLELQCLCRCFHP
ncbi:hypothetical protein BC829DRAFT_25383 [Chytridium lagenaria]|nr:hypothetical protein BC829DRAFT_25383 [Chytridium lagenaria]